MHRFSNRGFFWLIYGIGLALLASFAVGIAQAGEASLTWVHPTQYTDSTALPLSAISTTEVEYGVCNAGRTGFLTTPAPVRVSVPAPAAARVVTGLAAGTWCFRARTFVTGNTTPSDWSAGAGGVLASKVVLPPQPMPPTLSVADGQAYTILKREDRFVLLPVGTVPADTPCDTSQSVNGYYVVPNAAVTWTGTVRPIVVVAQCT